MKISCILEAQTGLGESSVCSTAEQALYWVDIIALWLHRPNPATGARHSWPIPTTIGCAALADNGELLVALRGGVHHFDAHTQHLGSIANPDGPSPSNRYNDVKIAPDGRFFLCAMDEVKLSRPSGTLHRIEAVRRAKRVLNGLFVSIGFVQPANGRTMFQPDSKAQKLMRHDYDPGTCAISNSGLGATPARRMAAAATAVPLTGPGCTRVRAPACSTPARVRAQHRKLAYTGSAKPTALPPAKGPD